MYGVNDFMERYAYHILHHPECKDISKARNVVSRIIADAHGNNAISVINDTVYRHSDGAHKGTSAGCFWVDE